MSIIKVFNFKTVFFLSLLASPSVWASYLNIEFNGVITEASLLSPTDFFEGEDAGSVIGSAITFDVLIDLDKYGYPYTISGGSGAISHQYFRQGKSVIVFNETYGDYVRDETESLFVSGNGFSIWDAGDINGDYARGISLANFEIQDSDLEFFNDGRSARKLTPFHWARDSKDDIALGNIEVIQEIDGLSDDEFNPLYAFSFDINSATATVVPIPSAVIFFLSGLGLVFWSKARVALSFKSSKSQA